MLIVSGLFALTNQWKIEHIEFPDQLLKIAIPAYSLVWMISLLFNGGYDFPIKLSKFIKGTFIGTLVILVIYALLPKEWQFSRLYILAGAIWLLIYYISSRIFLHFAIGKKFCLIQKKKKKFEKKILRTSHA